MKLFCLTVTKDNEEPENVYTIAKNKADARENIIINLKRYENSFLVDGDEFYTNESIEDLYYIKNVDQIPDTVEGYKVTLSKI